MQKPVKKTAPKKSRATTSTTAAPVATKPRVTAAKPRVTAAKPRVTAAKPGTGAGRTTRSTPAQGFELNHDAIATHAYDLFERSGHPHGRDVEFWLEAERQVKTRRKV